MGDSCCEGYLASDQHCPEHNALVDLYEDLCIALPINKLFPSLISNRVIDIHDKEEISHEASSRLMVEKFIEKHLYPEVAVGEIKRFNRFVKVMRRSEKCNHLVEKIERKVRLYQSQRASGRPAEAAGQGIYIII